jgi:hypothetical protein
MPLHPQASVELVGFKGETLAAVANNRTAAIWFGLVSLRGARDPPAPLRAGSAISSFGSSSEIANDVSRDDVYLQTDSSTR